MNKQETRALNLVPMVVEQSARGERGRPMHRRLAKELWDAAKHEGKAVTTKDNTHRMADANKAFAHFAW